MRWIVIGQLTRRVVTLPGAAAVALGGLVIAGCASASVPGNHRAGPVAGSPVPVTARSAQGACLAPYRNGDVPFPGGYRTTLTRAQSAVGFPVPVPHNVLVPRRNLHGVWVSQDAPLVALVYGKRKITILSQRWPDTPNPVTQNPAKWFRYERSIMVKNSAATERVNGEPALIVRPHTGYCPSNPALVEFYRSGLEIDVSSPGSRTAALVKIAQSIR